MIEGIMTIKMAADELGVSRRAIGDLIQRGRLPATKVGEVWLIERVHLDAYRASVAHRQRPGPKPGQRAGDEAGGEGQV